jgi:hypothetical protein
LRVDRIVGLAPIAAADPFETGPDLAGATRTMPQADGRPRS